MGKLTAEGWDPDGPWVSFVKAPDGLEELARLCAEAGVAEKGARAVYVNHLYQVIWYDEGGEEGDPGPEMIHLSIKRRDNGAIVDWRHMQQIKNELVGREHDGIQLFPAESRLLDTANQYHLYVFHNPDFRWPVGGFVRDVKPPWATPAGTSQRPFDLDLAPDEALGPRATQTDSRFRGPGLGGI